MKKFLLLTLTIFLSTVFISAQTTTGKIIGTVSAPDGVVPGATVVVADNQTNLERVVTTSSDGTFTVPQLEFGNYTVKVTATGFKTFTATDVKIDAGREYSLNALLEVGLATEQVTVTAGADQINSSNAELSSTISEQQIRELPLNGRNPLSLLNLQAGVNPTTNSINGQRSSSTTTTRDGLNIQDNFIRTNAFVSDQPTVDNTGQFSVTTQNAGAELGGGSSLIQLVTPRGGKDFHGALYIFNRNSEFAANGFFNNQRDVPRAFLNRNEFGGSISGPLAFPNFGEGGPVINRKGAYFFFNYEGFRLAQQSNASATTLLPQARNGNFTYIDGSGVTRTVNVLTGAGLNLGGANAATFANAGGVLSVDPIIQSRVLSQLPTSANGLTTGINFLQTLNFQQSDPRERNSFTARVDFDLDDRNSLNLVYKRNNDQDARTDIGSGFMTTPFVNQGGPTNFFVGAYRIVPTNNFTNEVRAGFQVSEPFFTEGNTPTDFFLGIPLVTNPQPSFRSQGRDTFYRNIQDNAVYTTGNHSIRFGGQAEFYKFEPINLGGTTPTFNISSTINQNTPGLDAPLFPGINQTDLARANSLRYLLGGIIGGGSVTANLVNAQQGFQLGAPQQRTLNYEVYSGYVSDQWRVRSNLTLNLGLRYEYYTPLNDPNGLFLEPNIPDPNDLSSVLLPGNVLNFVGTNAGKLGNFTKPDKDNFGPSVSFAYSPNFGKGFTSRLLPEGTVIRGGFRVNYVNDEYTRAPDAFLLANSGLGSQDIAAVSSTGDVNLNSTLTPRIGFEGLPTFTTPSFTPPPRTFALNNANDGFLGGVFGVDPNYQVQRNYEYNIGVQRKIGFDSVIELRYVGGRSNQAIRSIDFNQIDITDNGFTADFLRAQNNCRLQGARVNPSAPNPLFACTDASFNPNIPGSQMLTVLPRLDRVGGGNDAGLLTNSTVRSFIQQGRAGSLAQFYIQNRVYGDVVFQPIRDAFSVQILTNGGKYRYNALQAEIRRRFKGGVSYQVNYTFQKTLADVPDDSQVRQSPFQDNNNPGLQYGRPDYDRTHTVNANAIYELPFGKGKKFFNNGGIINAIFGGFQLTSIVNLSSGPPLGVTDPRSTSAITSRSGRQSALSSLTTNQIKDLTGVFNTPNGIYFVDPSVLFALGSNGQRVDLTQPLPAGVSIVSVRAAAPINEQPFDGQVFFFNNAGQTGNLPRNFINGLPFLNWDAGIGKNFRFGGEAGTTRLQVRMDVFNVLNKQVPFFGADLNIDSNNFGRVTGTYNGPRVIQFGARFDF